MINEIGRGLRGLSCILVRDLWRVTATVIDRLRRRRGEGNNGGRFVRVTRTQSDLLPANGCIAFVILYGSRGCLCWGGGARKPTPTYTRTHTQEGDASLEKCLVTRPDINPGPLKTGRVKNSGAKGAQHPWPGVVGSPGYLCSDGWSALDTGCPFSLSLSLCLFDHRSLVKDFLFFRGTKILFLMV